MFKLSVSVSKCLTWKHISIQGRAFWKSRYFTTSQQTPTKNIFSVFLSLAKKFSSWNLLPLCCIFQPVFGCCALQIIVEIWVFNIFCAKKLKKEEKAQKSRQNWAKLFFFDLHPKAGWGFYSQKETCFQR